MDNIIYDLLEVAQDIIASKDCNNLHKFNHLTLNCIKTLKCISNNINTLRDHRLRELFHVQLFTANGVSKETWDKWQNQFYKFDFSCLNINITEDNRVILASN